MWPVSAGFLDAVAKGSEKKWFASILGPDLEPLVASVKLGGTPEVQVNGLSISRRTCTLTVPDLPNIRDSLGPANPWRIAEGAFVDGALELVPVMTGWLDEDDEQYVGDGSIWTLPLRGREKLAGESTFTTPTTFLKGMRVSAFVRENLEAAGAGTDDGLYESWDDGGATLGVDHTYEEDVNRLAAIDQVIQDHALDLYADPLSAWVLRPFPDVERDPIVATFQRGKDVRMLSFRRHRRYLVKNHFVVVAAGAVPPVRVERKDEDPLSPTRITLIGDRVDKYSSDGITTRDQADAVVAARFATRGSIEEVIELDVPPNPALEGLDVIEVVEPRSGTSGRFLLESFNVPMSLTGQRLHTTRVRDAAA